jgi:hypothetical protein
MGQGPCGVVVEGSGAIGLLEGILDGVLKPGNEVVGGLLGIGFRHGGGRRKGEGEGPRTGFSAENPNPLQTAMETKTKTKTKTKKKEEEEDEEDEEEKKKKKTKTKTKKWRSPDSNTGPLRPTRVGRSSPHATRSWPSKKRE